MLALIVGLPGAGKTTYLKKHFRGFQKFSIDSFRTNLRQSPRKNIQDIVRLMYQAMQCDENVAIEGIFTFSRILEIKKAPKVNMTKIILIDTPAEICKSRRIKELSKYNIDFQEFIERMEVERIREICDVRISFKNSIF